MGGEKKAKRIAIMSIVAVILVTLVSATFIINTSDDSVAADEFAVGGITYTVTNETAKTVKLTKADGTIVTGDIAINTVERSVGNTYTITAISDRAFEECPDITSMTISDKVTSIDGTKFIGCSKLASITVGADNPNYLSDNGVLFDKKKTKLICHPAGKVGSYEIPSSVKNIGYYAFYGCTGLASITIQDSEEKPSELTFINFYAFYGCIGLTSITIPGGVTDIGPSAFQNCTGLESVIILGDMKTIGISVFDGCTGLKSVTIPDSVTSIGNFAFRSCTSLESVTIPDSVTSIGYQAFRKCTGLASITIPNSVTSIGISAFDGCTSLASITIPNSVTTIGNNAFDYCTGLTSVTVTGTGTAPASGDVISNYFKGTNWGLPGRTTGITTLTLEFSNGYAYDLSGITTIATGKIIFGSEANATTGGEFYTANGILYTDSKAGLSFTFNEKWKADNIYGVNFNANGGGTGSMSDQFFEKGVSGTLKQNDFTRTGYTFDGWNTQSDGKGKAYGNGEPITFPTSVEFNTLYAIWTANTYTVKFNPNNGSGTMGDQTFTFEVPQNLSKNLFIRDGYRFAGWNTQADGKGTSYADEASYTIGVGGATLYAQWAAEHTISFDQPAHGSLVVTDGAGNPIASDSKVDSGTKLTFKYTANEGYRFVSWNGIAGTNPVIVTVGSDLTVSVNEEIIPYTVKFNKNEGSGSMSDQTFEHGVAKNLSKNVFIRNGYTFAGWNTQADGKGTSYADEQSITPTSDMDLYAQWTPNEYTITFDANGGTVTPISKKVASGNAIGDLPTPTKDGYKFVKWQIDGMDITSETIWTYDIDKTAKAVFEVLPTPDPVDPVNPSPPSSNIDVSNVLYIIFAVLVTTLLASLVAVLLRSKKD